MNDKRGWRFAGLVCAVGLIGVSSVARGQAWTAPTAEELSMTSQAGAPGAAAVYLYREQTTDDGLHMYSYYVRLKVLNDGGKEYANVELPYYTGLAGVTVDSIMGRTIHADGTVIPFTGKPYEKLVGKGQGFEEKAKVFTLPAVEVGSVIEYRYKLRYDDNFVRSPDWFVQTDLYTRKAHYMWRPTNRLVMSEGESGGTSQVAWAPILPAGAAVKETPLMNPGRAPSGAPVVQLTLDVQDIPAIAKEAYMAPAESLSYRVLFYYTSVRSAAEYWKGAGGRWSKARDKFIGPGNGVKAFVNETVAASDTPEQKLKKLYDAVMKMENTDFTRQRSESEDKSNGLKQVANTDDILSRKRGDGDQLATLFVAMARAAGMKAYLMGVANRERRIFMPAYLSLSQLDDDIAIVNLDGKDVYFDPGERYCEFKHLAWVHADSAGVRQTDGGTAVVNSPLETYKTAHVSRIADLELDEHGEAKGMVKVTYNGDPALHWRHEWLRGDDKSLNGDLRREMERLLPGGMEVRVKKVENLEDADKPLQVEYEVSGAIGASTGKRLLVQANLFEANAKPAFSDPKREQAVYMHYPSYYQDAVRIKYPSTMTVESAPVAEQSRFESAMLYATSSKQSAGSITSFRNVQMARTFFEVKEYPELRSFYNKMETKDQETVVLIRAGAAAGTQ